MIDRVADALDETDDRSEPPADLGESPSDGSGEREELAGAIPVEDVLVSYSSSVVAADTPAKARSLALNVVEELAGERLDSDDDDERAAAELMTVAVRQLRPYVEAGIDDRRKRAWGRVFNAAVDLVPHGRQAIDFAKALGGLADAYGIPWTVGGPEDE